MREEEKNRSSQNSFFKKRWVFPAIYLVSAALLISMIIWYQTSVTDNAQTPKVTDNGKEAGKAGDEPVVEVNQSFENVVMPLKNEDEASIVTEFFDVNASPEKQEAALIVDGNKFSPSMGLDIAMKDGKDFEVLAALSGKVSDVRKDSLLGNVIEVEHEKGILTVYQSVKDIQVKAGDTVKQGDVIATSSTSQLNREAKNHVHFEIRKENKALNPLDFFGQPVTSIEDYESDADVKEELEETSDSEDFDGAEHSQPTETDSH